MKAITIPEYYAVNSFGEIYTGLHNGGKAKWSNDWKEGKPLSNINQLETLKRMLRDEVGNLELKIEMIYL
jgi:hypothetical protein